MMARQRKNLLMLLAFVSLLVSPVFGGCEASGAQECGMSACPMEAPSTSSACHDGASIVDSAFESCDDKPMSIACGAGPADLAPARIDAPSTAAPASVTLLLLTEIPSGAEPGQPPDESFFAVNSRLHQVGRFTLLSSFLL